MEKNELDQLIKCHLSFSCPAGRIFCPFASFLPRESLERVRQGSSVAAISEEGELSIAVLQSSHQFGTKRIQDPGSIWHEENPGSRINLAREGSRIYLAQGGSRINLARGGSRINDGQDLLPLILNLPNEDTPLTMQVSFTLKTRISDYL